MSSVIVKSGQSLTDVAIQEFGNQEAVFKLAMINDLSPFATLYGGDELELPQFVEKSVKNYFPIQGTKRTLEIKVLSGQTLTDIAIQELGSQGAVFELAKMNNLNVYDFLSPGRKLLLPPVEDKRIKAYFLNGKYKPASVRGNQQDEGIEFWAIEVDFIVQ